MLLGKNFFPCLDAIQANLTVIKSNPCTVSVDVIHWLHRNTMLNLYNVIL